MLPAMPTTPAPVARTVASPLAEYRQFQICDDNGPLAPAATDVGEGELIKVSGGLFLGTGGNDFHPDVTLEVWDIEPPAEPADAWELVEEQLFRTQGGSIKIRSWGGDIEGDQLPLAGPGVYRIRVHSRGRAEAAAKVGHHLYYYGVEHWLIQIWRGSH